MTDMEHAKSVLVRMKALNEALENASSDGLKVRIEVEGRHTGLPTVGPGPRSVSSSCVRSISP